MREAPEAAVWHNSPSPTVVSLFVSLVPLLWTATMPAGKKPPHLPGLCSPVMDCVDMI